ncbi:tetratricopeptide repeat protein, partial [Myxococcota bacterium]|nr:tetratricopeptide repeat protein [Myxococcota bacterium]
MALNKRKVLDSARKLAQKGAKAKALKEYQLLIQADPRDAKLLLEVGDCYRRWGQIEDAIAQYAKVAQQYRQDGFDARAVAVYKQILNLDPKHYAAYVSLSELYQRMGLDAEAIGALQTAADGYHREGRKSDALELLRQMAALDPTNVTSRLKVAELLRQEKMPTEALAEYEAAARELENQQDRDQLIAVRERILELKPDHVGSLCGMVRTLMVAGQPDRAEPFALRAVQASGDPPQYELLIELFAQMGNDAKLAEATRALAKLYRDRGDEDKARELMQRLPTDEVGARSRLAVDVSEIDEPEIADEELLDDDPFLTVSGGNGSRALDLGDDELELEAEDEIQLEVPKKGPPVPSASLEGDPDQLLAEASVYLRYGKRAQAIASLRAILDQDPNHRAALEKLGEAHADDGKPAEAVGFWLRAAALIRQAGDAKALAVLKDRIAALDPKAAASLTAPGNVPAAKPAAASSARAAARPPAPPPTAAAPDVELDLEVELDDAIETMEAPAPVDVADRASVEADEQGGFEIVFDDAELELASTEDGGETGSDDGSFEFEIDPGELSDDGGESGEGFSASDLGDTGIRDIEAAPGAEPSGATSARLGTTTAARIQEELEEAEFYLAQHMFDEAEAILVRILELAPNHPSAMLRMGEIRVARGAAPEAAPNVAEARTRAGRRVAGTSELDLGSTARFEDGLDLSSDGMESSGDEPDPESTSGSLELGPDSSSGALELDLDREGADTAGLDAAAEDEASLSAEAVDDSGFDVEVDLDAEAGTALEEALELDGTDSGIELTGSSDSGSDASIAPDESDSVLTMPSRPAPVPAPAPVAAPRPSSAQAERSGTIVLPRPSPSAAVPTPIPVPAPPAAPAMAAAVAAAASAASI